MNSSHTAFNGHPSENDSSTHGMVPDMLGFDSMMIPEHTFSQGLESFSCGPHGESCFVNDHHHFRQTTGDSKASTHFAQFQPSRRQAYTSQSQCQSFPGQALFASRAATIPSLEANGQASSWDTIFNQPALNNNALKPGLSLPEDDDCASDCDSTCVGPCPSQCGDTGDRVCCNDDACHSPQLCLDESCQGASRPCTDENCLVETPLDNQATSSHAITDGDKAAAVALASFGDNQLQMMQAGYMQPQATVSDSLLTGDPIFGFLPQTMPCGSFSMDSIFNNGPPSFPNQSCPMALEYTLANHIKQYHDPSHGLAHTGTCLANDPSQFISRCTLPKFYPNDNDTGSYLPQLQAHECGFQVQDPNAFAHHVLEEHRMALNLQAQKLRAMSHGRSQLVDQAGVLHHAGHHTGPRSAYNQLFSPTTSSSTNISLGHSISTPSTQATPSPFGSDLDKVDQSSSIKPVGNAEIAKSAVHNQQDQFVCRWVTGDDGCICGERFEKDEQLQQHCKMEHLKQLNKTRGGFRCGWADCTRDTCFTQRSKLERHMQVHTGFKPVTCHICGAALSAKQALDQHMRIHTGETPWVCTFPGCGCSFKQQSALTMHERTHTGVKPLECEICHKKFSESSNLSKHRRTHNVKGLHECQFCDKDFHRLDQLRRHMSTNHKDRSDEVDALLNEAKPRTLMKGVLKSSKASGKSRLKAIDAGTLELIGDELHDVLIEQEA